MILFMPESTQGVQADDPKMLDIPFADRVAMLVDKPYLIRGFPSEDRKDRYLDSSDFLQPIQTG